MSTSSKIYLELEVAEWFMSDLLTLCSPSSLVVIATGFLNNCSVCNSEYTSFSVSVLAFALLLKSQFVSPTRIISFPSLSKSKIDSLGFSNAVLSAPGDYMPISVILVFSRILRRLAYDQLYESLKIIESIICNQAAFRK